MIKRGMSKRKGPVGQATDIAVYGLLGLAEKNRRPISEEAVVQARRIIELGQDGGTVSSADVLAAAESLNPGDLYVQGLRGIAKVEGVLKRTTKKQIRGMVENHQEEHVEPTKKAFRFLTGREFEK